ncbi:MAG: glycosyltransferase family 2 protein [Actinomycetota bacterium]|nr:glycosyltransferase family 2 protein [Actinomycetota bacterium]
MRADRHSEGRGDAEPLPAISVSAVVVYYRDPAHLAACLDSVCGDQAVSEVIVVDNASGDGVAEAAAASRQAVRVVAAERNLGFGGGANLGAALARGDVLVFLNPDVVVDPGALDALGGYLARHDGIAGPVVWQGSSSAAECGSTVDRMLLHRGLPAGGPAPLYVTGCCLAMTRRCFDAVGGFEERFFLINEDVELCWQALRRGFDVAVVPNATVRHVGGTAIGGGYRTDRGIETTAQRVVLRERSSWGVLLACVPSRHLATVAGASLVRAAAFGALLAAHGTWRAAASVWAGPIWGVALSPGSLARRRRPGVDWGAEAGAWDRVSRMFFAWDLLRRGERLTFVDGRPGRNRQRRPAA